MLAFSVSRGSPVRKSHCVRFFVRRTHEAPGGPIFFPTINHLNPTILCNFMELPPEQPIYVVYESKSRALLPKVISLVLLATVFYLGVLLNVSLLELDAQQETGLKSGALILLLLLIFLGVFLAVRKVRIPYNFYQNRISRGKEVIFYSNISNTSLHLDPLDRIFKTYSINLGKNFFLRNIPQEIQLSNYIQQLINYARSAPFYTLH